MKPTQILPVLALTLLAGACSNQPTVFQQLDARQTGIDFSNDLITNDTFNAILFEYIYNGGGVAASDVNNDGLIDLFFTGNQVSSKLYLNRGNLKFEDVTLPAGVSTDRWCTGVAIADVNDDGKQDIYISVAGFEVPEERMENLLFINQGWDDNGIPTFKEAAKAYGVNDAGYSTQAAFFDYDLDGDLDMYLLTNAMERFNRNNLRPKRVEGEAASTDRLYRNNGDATFTNVSTEAGITIEGYGLGVQVTDLNFDGYPDVYTANDFQSNDLVWINQGDGTFTNQAGQYLKHQTHNGMGVDIADFNNDALPDIAVLDMLPEDNYRQKMMIPYVNPDKFQMKKDLGYQDQYMRNTLQMHQGFTEEGTPKFSEIGNLAGIAATDWSWSVLFADFDNDGWKDAYITNGYRKDVTNLDFINYSSFNQMFGTAEAKRDKAISELAKTPDVEVSNYMFHNKGENLRFENVADAWGIGGASFSNGAAYTDLDNDGDLDLVVNNIDAKAFVFENKMDQQRAGHHYLQIELREDQPNVHRYNTKVFLHTNQGVQYQEFSPYRGYKSTVDEVLHFGLGEVTQIDSIVVRWPDQRTSVLTNITPDQRLQIHYENANKTPVPPLPLATKQAAFKQANQDLGIAYQHADNSHSELESNRTLLHDYSKTGPAIASGDINGDGFEDFFVGGNHHQAGAFFIQNNRGEFTSYPMPHDSSYQDVAALLFDADGDKDLDLYVVSGGTYAGANSPVYQDRLYQNDGRGEFLPLKNALPEMKTSGACVTAADYDQDGDLDLFVGGRIVPDQYPIAPRSYLLRNEGGRFTDATPEDLQELGLVTDARWTDINSDQQMDLVIVGEWMPITFFENRNGQLEKINITIDGQSQKTNGWWMHVNAADLDGDGDTDYLVGNLGLNSKLKASEREPVRLYAKDFDDNGQIDPLFSCYIQGEEYLMHERDLLIRQIPGIKRRFPDYGTYAESTVKETLSEKDLKGAIVKNCYLLASIILENTGNRQFRMHELPSESQLSPVMGSVCLDMDQNGTLDMLTAGNLQATETTQIGWYDSSYGNVLLQNEPMQFQSTNPLNHNLQADGDVRRIQTVQLANGQTLILFGVYGGKLKAYSVKQKIEPFLSMLEHNFFNDIPVR